MTARRRWLSELASDVEGMSYSFLSCEGVLRLPAGGSVGMGPALDLFRGLDPEVRVVRIHAGNQPLATFRREANVWDVEREPMQPRGPRRRSTYGRGRIRQP